MAATLATPTAETVANLAPPDFFHCDRVYGTSIRSDDCIKAAAMLLDGERTFTFVRGPDGGFPMYRSHGTSLKIRALYFDSMKKQELVILLPSSPALTFQVSCASYQALFVRLLP